MLRTMVDHDQDKDEESIMMNNPEEEKGGKTAGSSNSSSSRRSHWIHLKERKEFSRLLYPNPVCFLSTYQGNEQKQPNVMILSWLTATNNYGRFMFSINKRRHSAQQFLMTDGQGQKQQEFTLSIPVAGMEDLVLAVGSTSGRLRSKFPSSTDDRCQPLANSRSRPEGEGDKEERKLSSRQKRKQQQLEFSKCGISNLHPVEFGKGDDYVIANLLSSSPSSSENNGSADDGDRAENDSRSNRHKPFCIKGTVAHLHCRVYNSMKNDDSSDNNNNDNDSSNINHNDIIDQGHILILAEVIDAYCRSDYWDPIKKLFRPIHPEAPPYLTFFGSQSFGYVVADAPTTTATTSSC